MIKSLHFISRRLISRSIPRMNKIRPKLIRQCNFPMQCRAPRTIFSYPFIQCRNFMSSKLNYKQTTHTDNNFKSRIIYSLKRNRKRWTSDDLFALLSWLFLSHTFFLLVGTTTFISLLLIILNSLQFQELIAYLVGRHITALLNATVIFESAIIPSFKEGKIVFKDITVSKSRPDEGNVGDHYYYSANPSGTSEIDYSQVNHTLLDLTIKEVKVKLSLINFLFGKGLITSAELKGIRGEFDKRFVDYSIELGAKLDPNEPDIAIDGLKVSDLSINMIYADFRPIKIDVFNGHCKTFRKNWIVHDILKSDSITGMYDDCLFSLHNLENNSDLPFQSVSVKIDNLPIDLFNYGATGPLGWINQGTVDLNAVIHVPTGSNHSFVSDLKEITWQISKLGIPQEVQDLSQYSNIEPNSTSINFTMYLKMKDLKADVPTNLNNIFGWNAFARPIVGFLNNHHTNVSIVSNFTMETSDFNGAWSIYNCGLVDCISKAAGISLFKLYQDERLRSMKLKRLGIWSLGEMAFSLLRLFDYLRGRQEWYLDRSNMQHNAMI
eukprot:NODE_237_length_13348_cov_0.297381.p2 type:complete len:550 gc:universal NODE_237_length_13348_cov_0.297381:2901-1252(-)